MEKKLKVLVVDDEEQILKSIKLYFSFFNNVEMELAASFNEAVDKINSLHPRITITDINLPDGNGIDLIKLARKNSAVNQIIIITGNSDLSRVMDALELGAIDYLKKPLDMQELKAVVDEAVNRYQRWHELVRDEIQR